ncbi:hypothetical protein HYN69_03250 [Gemmobacter aquarius]|uniref:Uncharacterized protein n=1 Tax=Paragemmobacter aquarius TaxID=2169400 RepID=A0A2S0UII8_9RHOB|nr:hypothetical protein [Gemmobacter aquarius]AWB47647.1 hypothetical protein HYN69_03250 [Gemmobacter aquarius]
MFDPNREDFNARVLRLRREHALGRGFEAGGALGRSAFRREAVRRRPALRAGLFIIAFAFGMKGALHAHLGPDGYAERVAQISTETTLSGVPRALMAADPLTVLVSDAIKRVRVAL